MKSKVWLFAAAALAATGCGGGGGSTGGSSASGGGSTGTGGDTNNPVMGGLVSATFKVDVSSGQVTVISTNVSPAAKVNDATPKAIFTDNTVSFNSSQLLNDIGTGVNVRSLSVSMTNQMGVPIGQDPNGNAKGLAVLFGPISNLATAQDLRPLVNVSTLAGTGTSGSTNGPAGSAQFRHPQGAALDPSGAIYVTDDFGANIRKISNGTVTTFAGGGTAGADGIGASAGFSGPRGIAYNPVDQAFFVADFTGEKIRRVTQTGRVTTIAGTGVAAEGDGTGTTAKFNGPDGVTCDSQGNIYVSDSSGDNIRKITFVAGDRAAAASYNVTTLAGTGVAGSANGAGAAASFHTPSGLAVDTSGDLFVADTANNKIRMVDTTTGSTTTIAGTGGGGDTDGLGSAATFAAPRGLVYLGGGLVVSETGTNVLREMQVLDGASVSSASSWQVSILTSGGMGAANGGGSSAQFNGPGYLAASASNAVFVADLNNFDIRKLTPTTGAFPVGTPTGSAGTGTVSLSGMDGQLPSSTAGLSTPYIVYPGQLGAGATSAVKNWTFDVPAGVNAFTFTATVTADTSFISTVDNTSGNSNNNNFVRSIAGLPTLGFADGPPSSAQFDEIGQMATDAAGDLFVADRNNNAIRMVDTTGTTYTIAGVTGISGIADGTGQTATFNNPNGVAVSKDGHTVYEGDFQQSRLAKITLTAGADPHVAANWTVTTIAGSGSTGVFTSAAGNVAEFNEIGGIALDPSGKRIYVAEINGNRIRVVTFTGANPNAASSYTVTELAGDNSAFNGASGTTDGSGNSARFFVPIGLACLPNGNLVVADEQNERIRMVTPGGVVTTLAGSIVGYVDGDAASSQFYLPQYLAVNPAGTTVYLTELFGDHIRALSLPGGSTTGITVSTVAGTAAAGYQDGPAGTASLEFPTGIAMTPDGNLIFADANSGTIREVDRNYSTTSP